MYMQILHGGKEVQKFEPLGGVDTIPLPCLPRRILTDLERLDMRGER